MGFPLAQTPVYSFINALVELQTTGYRTIHLRNRNHAAETPLHPATFPQCRNTGKTAYPGQPLLSPSLGAEAGRIP